MQLELAIETSSIRISCAMPVLEKLTCSGLQRGSGDGICIRG